MDVVGFDSLTTDTISTQNIAIYMNKFMTFVNTFLNTFAPAEYMSMYQTC